MTLTWYRDGNAYRLVAGRRQLGRVVPDETYSDLWHPVFANGHTGDMTNLSRAKDAVRIAAEPFLRSKAA